jgi:hypothetical protein
MDDNSQFADLPMLRCNAGDAIADLERFGYAKVSEIMSPEEIRFALRSSMQIAVKERQNCNAIGGSADDPNQRVYRLIGRAPLWDKIVTHPLLLTLMHQVLGPRIKLFSLQVILLGNGSRPILHVDQMYASNQIPVPLLSTAIIMLDDFTLENGATYVIPGSHNSEWQPYASQEAHAARLESAISLTGKAGTAIVFGGKLEHAVGENRSGKLRRAVLIHYCLPWMQTFERFENNLSNKQIQNASPNLRSLLSISNQPTGMGLGLSSEA